MPEKIPKHIGYGEGGGNLPSLAEILELVAKGLKEAYDEVDDLNPGERPLMKHDEDFLEVEETTPEDGAEDVDKSNDIEVEFKEDIEYWKDKATTEGELEVKNITDDTDETIDDIDITGDNTLVIKPDTNWTAEKELRVTVPKATVISQGDKLGMKEDLVFTFTTGE